MNKLLIIENESDDFEKIKKKFEDCGGWIVLPENQENIQYEDEGSIILHINECIKSSSISAIIMDIALKGEKDTTGLDIISSIRNTDYYKNKIIPIYCYSNYGRDNNVRIEGFKKGATNIFSKAEIISEYDFIFLKNSLTALAFNYAYVCSKSLYLEEVNKFIQEGNTQLKNQIENLNNKIDELLEIDKVNLQTLLDLSSYQNIVDLTEINDTNKQTIIDVIGQDAFDNLLQAKWRKEDSEQQKKLIENIEGLVSVISGYFPILLPVIPVIKLFLLFLKMK